MRIEYSKLYMIKFTLKDGTIIDVWTTSVKSLAMIKIQKNPEWTFKVTEDNEYRKVWVAV